MAKQRTAISLFSGCGGLDLGFVQAGFKILTAYDHWAPSMEVYSLNASILGDVKTNTKSLCLADNEVTLDDFPKADVILGGPPCQGFSFAGRQSADDPRNKLYQDFVKIVNHVRPRAFLMENVRGMEAMALKNVIRDFKKVGYTLVVTMARAQDFDLAQRRERLIIVGFEESSGVLFEPPSSTFGELFGATKPKSILETIHDLPVPFVCSDSGADLPDDVRSHAIKPLPDLVQRFVRHIPNGGCFRDAPRKTLPDRLKKILDDPQRYRSPRLFPKPDPSEPAQTIPADTNPSLGGVLAPDLVYGDSAPAMPADAALNTKNGLYTSPSPSRRLSPREAARLQGFPDEFTFRGSITTQFQMIGNAVPVAMARAFAEGILEQLPSEPKRARPKKT